MLIDGKIALYVSGAKAGHLEVALESSASYLVLCLEDGTPENLKDEARYLVKEAIKYYKNVKRICCVRINGPDTQHWYKDIELLYKNGSCPDRIRLPMARSLEDVKRTIEKIEQYQDDIKNKYIELMVENIDCYNNIEMILNKFSDKICTVTVGGEDLLESVAEEERVDQIKKNLIKICDKYSIPCLETTFMDYKNIQGLIENTKEALNKGFSGRSVIHPSHIKICEELVREYV
ncbi:HpcH/HpaI aldolase/citrate lyase family protein [Xenorhabdus bovienii]|uniref:HpcH/HpaI aldolase/citrate lyase family protein n=1 Tax=Xenorhabdus bovienii TaxID=40576 RepID=UPI0023B2430E|nr:aldolase/citrate lyase family protein [Xenorhabdus bovienii]MDE9453249.1 hypothetical protein [Xenorhabdus bovienii]